MPKFNIEEQDTGKATKQVIAQSFSRIIDRQKSTKKYDVSSDDDSKSLSSDMSGNLE